MAIYNGFETEKDVLFYWKEKKIFDKLRNRNEGKKHFSFIDGPITANNPMGVHHAWGRTLKDLFQRYKAMQGCDERYQNGFDCQGLWLEVETEKDLGFNSKKDIENFGLDTFSKACRRRVEKFSKVQTEQSMHLGQWMDWGNDYYTMSNTNIEAIWFFLKKCHEKGWLYKGYRILPWCIRCGTSSSKHEMSDEGYADLVHPSIYVKARIKGRNNEYLLIWTTTEWTLSSNVAAAVNPNVNYVQIKSGNETIYTSEATAGKIQGDHKIIKKLKGKDIVGLEYEPFYPDLEVQKQVRPKVISSEDISETDGTGIVHIAPTCGDIDYELGKKFNLKILDTALDELGNYNKGYGWLSGKNVRNVKKDIVKDLQARGLLYFVEDYKHRYPICWRCKHELVFRLDTSWFISCNEIRPIMKKEAAKIIWYPEHTGKLMQDWLDNKEDWNISRKRYWGLPLMFYECDKCNNLEIIGSLKELREKSFNKKDIDNLPELHRPWIDKIKIKCKCGQNVGRIKDVGDCWLDAGIVPFSTLKYSKDKKYWKKWFPADLEIEMRAQIRLWFYAQLFMSVVLEGVAPYKRILAYEEVRDEKGETMHKSKGNAIWFDDAVEKMGSDIMRWMYCSQNPQYYLNFGYGPAKEARSNLLTIENLATYIKGYCKKPAKSNSNDQAILWLLSRRENLKLNVTSSLDNLEYHKAFESIKNFLINDISKTYVQFIRENLDNGKVQKVLYDSYFEGITLLAPFLPFITEKINIEVYNKDSIHLQQWPNVNRKLINKNIEEKMEYVKAVIQQILAERNAKQINVRWPLKEVTITTKDQKIIDTVKLLKDLILKQTNIKSINISIDKKKDLEISINTQLTEELEIEGYTREVIRRIQALRKKAGLKKDDCIELSIKTAQKLDEKTIKKIVGAKTIKELKSAEFMDKFTIKDKEFEIGFNTVK